ncbi:MAG: PQ-loop domain-containing transporter [Planctomycetota bacterium]
MATLAATFMAPEVAQMLAGFLFAGAYVPQIMRMRQTGSSKDVSLAFLVVIITALSLSTWWVVSVMFPSGEVPIDWKMMPLLATNILNGIMVVVTLIQALKLR